METQIQPNKVTITQKEAEEYRAYKRQKKISEIMAAMRRSGSVLTGNDSVPRLVERATRLHQISVRLRPTDLLQRGEPFLNSPLRVDCLIGGNGETFTKVKAYEAKCALRVGAKELTLVLPPSLVSSCRYQMLRKELKKLRRVAKKTPLKARVEKVYPQATMARLARLCAETKMDYFSIPYFSGCQHLQAEPIGGCLLEVTGVDTLSDFKEMAVAGIGRILTSRAWEIYTEWLKETEKIVLEEENALVETAEKPLLDKKSLPEEKSKKECLIALPPLLLTGGKANGIAEGIRP